MVWKGRVVSALQGWGCNSPFHPLTHMDMGLVWVMVTSLNRQPSATIKLMSGRNNDKEVRTNHWGREWLPPLFHSVLIHNCPNKQSYTAPRIAHLIMFVCIAPKIKHSMVGHKLRTLWLSLLPSAPSLSHCFKPSCPFCFSSLLSFLLDTIVIERDNFLY